MVLIISTSDEKNKENECSETIVDAMSRFF
jgi:hypothetical protein